ncbi:hypothetical protein JD276_13135 [Leucobacter sp. CSA1]|uniref:Uncharacterized protein n=1 Tax=Leucobacter chromiisoli TaxID=2796471 RepID=A0A934UVJ4_9MICO|nr:hypothetical protein [Leucobacter chromiisoli]MBK0419975.1 hypothetical protein [Leucobacter chromiisoli]
MTAIEILERAICKLEQLRDEATPGEWWATRDLKWPSVFAGTGMSDDVMVASECRLPGDAALIVALSRTVGPMLAHMRLVLEAMRQPSTAGCASADEMVTLHLARAILGEENDHDR